MSEIIAGSETDRRAPPMQGIVGGTYDRFLAGQTAVSDPESQLYLPPDVGTSSFLDCPSVHATHVVAHPPEP